MNPDSDLHAMQEDASRNALHPIYIHTALTTSSGMRNVLRFSAALANTAAILIQATASNLQHDCCNLVQPASVTHGLLLG